MAWKLGMMPELRQEKAAYVDEGLLRQEWQSRKIDDWLLAVLRFAITLNDADKAVVLALADDMDRLGVEAARPAFEFFLRASVDLCNAIVARDDPNSVTILRRHIARIEEPRLKRAVEAALDLGSSAPTRPR